MAARPTVIVPGPHPTSSRRWPGASRSSRYPAEFCAVRHVCERSTLGWWPWVYVSRGVTAPLNHLVPVRVEWIGRHRDPDGSTDAAGARRPLPCGSRHHAGRGCGVRAIDDRGSAVPHWTEYGIRQMPAMSARHRDPIPAMLQVLIDARTASMAEPLIGVTTDGRVHPGLFELQPTGISTGPVTEAAHAFLAALSAEQRDRVVFPLDSDERRRWLNIHPNVFRHGILLESLADPVRGARARARAVHALRPGLPAGTRHHAAEPAPRRRLGQPGRVR